MLANERMRTVMTLDAVLAEDETHAIDAVGVGMLAALRPQEASWITERRTEA